MTTPATSKLENSRNAPRSSWTSVLGKTLFLLCAVLALVLFAGLVTVLGLQALGFFSQTAPQVPHHLSQFLATTVVTSLSALLFTVPIGLLAALFLSEFATARTRGWLDESLRFLAQVPPIVYGYFSVATFLPALAKFVPALREYPALEGGIALAGMLVPSFIAQSRVAIAAIPQQLRDGACALGASKFSTAWFVVIPAAKARLLGALVQSASRAIGETMIVLVVFVAHASRHTDRPQTLTTLLIPDPPTPMGDFIGLQTRFTVACVLIVIALLLDAARLHLQRLDRGESR